MMSPPLPPSPPSGPPYSMNFSRRKLTAPGPPAPERMKILAWSRKCMAPPLTPIVAKGQRACSYPSGPAAEPRHQHADARAVLPIRVAEKVDQVAFFQLDGDQHE